MVPKTEVLSVTRSMQSSADSKQTSMAASDGMAGVIGYRETAALASTAAPVSSAASASPWSEYRKKTATAITPAKSAIMESAHMSPVLFNYSSVSCFT